MIVKPLSKEKEKRAVFPLLRVSLAFETLLTFSDVAKSPDRETFLFSPPFFFFYDSWVERWGFCVKRAPFFV